MPEKLILKTLLLSQLILTPPEKCIARNQYKQKEKHNKEKQHKNIYETTNNY